MDPPNELPPLFPPSTSWDRLPVEYDAADFHTAITMYTRKLYGASLPPPSAQLFLDRVMHDGLLLPLGREGGGFVRKKPLLPLWVEFITTIWQPMYKGPKLEPLDFSDTAITASRGGDFLRWLGQRRTYNVDAAGRPADGTRWWPRDVGGVIAAVQHEHIKKLRDEGWEGLGMTPLERAKILKWFERVEHVGWEEGMLLGMVSKEHDERAPLAEVLRRPASDFDDAQQPLGVEHLRLGAEASDVHGLGIAAPPALGEGEMSIAAPAGNANEHRRAEDRQDVLEPLMLAAVNQQERPSAMGRRGAIVPEELGQHQHQQQPR